jgi:hypothetical protein
MTIADSENTGDEVLSSIERTYWSISVFPQNTTAVAVTTVSQKNRKRSPHNGKGRKGRGGGGKEQAIFRSWDCGKEGKGTNADL